MEKQVTEKKYFGIDYSTEIVKDVTTAIITILTESGKVESVLNVYETKNTPPDLTNIEDFVKRISEKLIEEKCIYGAAENDGIKTIVYNDLLKEKFLSKTQIVLEEIIIKSKEDAYVNSLNLALHSWHNRDKI